MASIKEKELIAQACINLSGKLGGSEISSAMSRNRILDSTISVADTTFGVIAKSVVMSSNMSFTIPTNSVSVRLCSAIYYAGPV